MGLTVELSEHAERQLARQVAEGRHPFADALEAEAYLVELQAIAARGITDI